MQDLADIVSDPDLRTAALAALLGLALSCVLSVLVHEAGHALFGRLAGYRVRAVRIGRGPVLFRLHLGLGVLVWRLLPVSGAVSIYRPLADMRRARLLLIAGGCLANLAAAAALAAVLPWSPDPLAQPVATFVLIPVLIAQALSVLNLAIVVGPGRVGTTDGGLFRAALRRPAVMPNHALARLYEEEVSARDPSLSPEPPSALAAVVLHAVLIGTPEAGFGDLAALDAPGAQCARTRLRAALLARGGLTAAERAVLLDAAVTEALLAPATVDLARLDAWSSALVALVPNAPSARATRGAVLVLLGREEGRALLEADLGADEAPFARTALRLPGEGAPRRRRPRRREGGAGGGPI